MGPPSAPDMGISQAASPDNMLNLGLYWEYIGIMEKKMEATMAYWDFIGIMEKKVEATLMCFRGSARTSMDAWDPTCFL